MLCDISFLSLYQETPLYPPFDSKLVLKNEQDGEFGRYIQMWPFFSSRKGVLYRIEENDPKDEFDSFCDSDFEEPEADGKPFWISEDAWSDMTSLLVREDCLADFIKLVDFLLDTSPSGYLLFLPRYQITGPENHDNVCGVIGKGQFFKMLSRGDVRFNCCYVLSNWDADYTLSNWQLSSGCSAELLDIVKKQVRDHFARKEIVCDRSVYYFYDDAVHILKELGKRRIPIKEVVSAEFGRVGIAIKTIFSQENTPISDCWEISKTALEQVTESSRVFLIDF